MNVAIHDIVAVVSFVASVLIAVISVRHKLSEVAGALAEIAKEWVNNRTVGQKRDQLWETVNAKIDENTRETRMGFERQAAIIDQRLALQDTQIAEVKSSVAAALSEIAAIKLHVSTLGAKS